MRGKEIEYCPKDGIGLAICAGSTGVFPHYYQGECGRRVAGGAEAHGEMLETMPSNIKSAAPARIREQDWRLQRVSYTTTGR